MSVSWTDEQKSAIDCPVGKGSILVSAAAGSGKTAVLVERILKNILDGKGEDIDRFLIVTFTKAAASGMKQKIRRELQKQIDDISEKWDVKKLAFLERQMNLLASADITTIDSFCLHTVKNNFHYLGIDPGFKNTDAEEDKIICDNVLDEMFEQMYDENDGKFLQLIDSFASYRNDYNLLEIVKAIYRFTENFANPDEWVDEKCKEYCEDILNSVWTNKYYLGDVKNNAKRYKAKAEGILNDIICFVTDGAENDYFAAAYDGILNAYTEDFVNERCEGKIHCISALKSIVEICTKAELADTPIGMAYCVDMSELPQRINSKWEEELKDIYSRTRDLAKECNLFFSKIECKDEKELMDKWNWDEVRKDLDNLAYVVKKFRQELNKTKAKKGVWSFSDIEHMAYDLFDENESVRKAYRKKYKEILIDEYQDTNDLQDAIFRKISRDGKNIFMVGDLKQSIYGFRGGDPYIFKKRSNDYELYNPEHDGDKKIILSRNFRSRPEVLDSVNELFHNIMSDNVGDVDYNDEHSLHYEAKLPDNAENEINYKSEFHMVINADKENCAKELCEARYTAQKIKELIGKSYYDSQSGEYKKISYRDITVLTRSVSAAAACFLQAFREYGVPLYIEQEDYFNRREISTMTSLLSVIVNHRQDIELISVMRSPIFGFSYDELAQLRVDFGRCERDNKVFSRKYFYDCVEECAKSESKLAVKCRQVCKKLNYWRDFTRKRSVSELIWTIFEETAFYDYMGALEGGTEAQSNLRLLYERAKKFEETGKSGLFAFINYLNQIKTGKSDMNGANITGADCVTMTTSHKSKGLEYPIVFLVGAGKSMKAFGKEPAVQLHKDLGIGLMHRNKELDCYERTFFYDYIKMQKRAEGISELMRLLYVALTRPKYKLYVVAVQNEDILEKDILNYRSDAVSDEYISGSDGIYQWMIPIVKDGSCWDYIEYINEPAEEAEEEETKDENTSYTDEEFEQKLKEVDSLLSRRYKYENISMIPSRTTATELKKLEQENNADNLLERGKASNGIRRREFSLLPSPEFEEKTLRGARVGTAYHQIMAYINPVLLREELSRETVRKEIERIVGEGKADSEVAEKYGENMTEDIYTFFKSELGAGILNAKELFRERNFQTYIGAEVYNKNLTEESASENIILQGIIDCMYRDSMGRYILLDYKTDNCTARDYSKTVDKYRIQLELYTYAVEKIMGIKIYKKYLYLFAVKKSVEVE